MRRRTAAHVELSNTPEDSVLLDCGWFLGRLSTKERGGADPWGNQHWIHESEVPCAD